MSSALSLLLSLAGCTLLRGKLLPPRDVRLEAQNFHVRLRWEPDPSWPNGTTYQVEWRNTTFDWTKADACWGNSTSSSSACDLCFDAIHSIYWARVRVMARDELSEWAKSSELQLYRDTIVGPPMLSWLLQGHNLSVNLTMPLTPYPCTNGSHEPVDQVLQKLRYWLQLYEGDLLVQVVPCRWRGEKEPCTFGPLKSSTHYCVRTVAVEMATQSREAEQCVVTPPDPAGFPWFLLVLLSAVLPLLILAGFCSIHLQVLPSPSEMHLPETLQGLQNRELSKTMGVPALELKEDSLSLLLPPMSPSHGLPAAEQGVPAVRLLLRGSLPQDVSGYCANGFGPGCCEGQHPSCTLGRPGHAFSYQISSQLEEDEEADEDNVLEQLVSVGQGRDSYTGDGDYGISETLLSQHLQLYSKCQCPALGAGSCLPLPAPGRSFSQEDLQESLGVPGHGVQLSSVKLHASEEEDGRQLIHALQPLWTELQPGDSTVQPGNPEPTAPGIPCQLPQLPSKALQAAAFSGYELRPQADGEP